MTIEVDEKIIGTWFVSLPNHSDFLAAMKEIEPGKYELTYRFRYADPLEPGANPLENIDRKVWNRGVLTGSRDFAMTAIRASARALAAIADSEVCELLMNPERDVERFVRELSAMPFATTSVKGRDENFEQVMKNFGMKE